MNFRKFAPTTVLSVSYLLISTSAYAFDATAFVERQINLAKQQGFEITYGDLKALGSDGVELSDVKFKLPEVPDPVQLKSLKVEGVEDLGNDNFAAAKMNLSGLLLRLRRKTVSLYQSASTQ